MTAPLNIPPGTQFGSLTVIREVERGQPLPSTGQRCRRFLCRCRCGGEAIYWRGNLREGKSTQCKECGYAAMRKTERNEEILAAYVAGRTIGELAEEYGIGASRLCTIIPIELRPEAHPHIPAGTRFGRWVVVNSRTETCRYECRCDCGTRRLVLGSQLTCGSSKSCGCSSNVPRCTGASALRRNAEIVRRARKGESRLALAREFGLTRQRVHQIVNGR